MASLRVIMLPIACKILREKIFVFLKGEIINLQVDVEVMTSFCEQTVSRLPFKYVKPFLKDH